MGAPLARSTDRVVGLDTHIVMVPAGPSLVPTPLPHPFAGVIDGATASSVVVAGQPAATVDSTATNTPSHIPTPPGTTFQRPPSNKATIKVGSQTVKIAGKAAARTGDTAQTCNDPADAPVGTVVASGTVMVGG